MTKLKNLAARFRKDQSGATAIEYSLIAALVGVASVTVLTTLGQSIVAKFTEAAAALS